MKTTLIACALLLASCGLTPRERYNVAAGGLSVASMGLAKANEQHAFTAKEWQQIQTFELKAADQFRVANQWLNDNPTLADTAGAPFPPLDPVNITVGVLWSELSKANGVVIIPPSVKPTTQPN